MPCEETVDVLLYFFTGVDCVAKDILYRNKFQ